MTLDTFLKELKAAVVGKEHRGTAIKRFCNPGGSFLFCPITLVHYHRTGEVLAPHLAGHAAVALGLSLSDTSSIISASDSSGASLLRERLEEAWDSIGGANS
jgi:hypothetical protein